MKKIKLADSSNIRSAFYCTDLRTLTVEFQGGGVYHYFNVGIDQVVAWQKVSKAGGSVGSWFCKNIKGKYAYEAVVKRLKKIS